MSISLLEICLYLFVGDKDVNQLANENQFSM